MSASYSLFRPQQGTGSAVWVEDDLIDGHGRCGYCPGSALP
jgi:hypothetical protein